IDYRIQTLANSSFNMPQHDKTILHNDLVTANNFVKQDDLFDAVSHLQEAAKNISTFIIEPRLESNISSEINNTIGSFKTASTTGSITPGQSSCGYDD